MTEYDDKIQELKERLMQLEFELEEKNSEILALKKENQKLYDGVKQAMDQASMYRTELEKDRVFYGEKIARLAKEKAKLYEELDILKVEFEKTDRIFSTVTEAKTQMKKDSMKLMDEVRETSMDAVTMIEYVLKDIAKMKLDLENLSKAENAAQSDIDDEISLMIDLLNKHNTYLTTIKSGFYKINNIQEYENSFDDLSLVRNDNKLVNGNYVD